MGLVFDSVEAYEAALDAAIDACFTTGTLVEGVKNEIQEAMIGPVYGGYSPEFFSRRGASGGLIDTANMDDEYGGKTLTVKLTADWQNIGFRKTTGAGTYDELSDVVESKGMYGAPARPYVNIAEEAAAKEVEEFLPIALVGRGF